MKIGIDIDNVIADFVSKFLPRLSNLYCCTIEDIVHYDFKENINIDDEAYKKIWSEVEKDRIYQELDLIKHAKVSLEKLSFSNEIYLVSSRENKHHVDTLNWLHKHDLKFTELFLTGSRKEKIQKMCSFDLVIEDDLEVARKIAHAGVRVILFDYPWNRISKNIKRVQGWKEAMTEIES